MQTITYLFIILAAFWLIDLYQTLQITRKYGVKVEENPVARFLLKHSRKDFAAFKILDLLVLFGILALISEKQEVYAEYLTALFICFYILTAIHNWNAYKNQLKTISGNI